MFCAGAGKASCARLEEACLSKAGEDFTRVRLQLPGKKFPSGGGSSSSSSHSSSGGGSPASSSGERGRMPVLERYFHSAELGRRWPATEGVLPSSLGSRPGCQQGPLPWDLPEMMRMVKLVWKSKSELQATKPRGILENEDAFHSFPGKLTVGCRREPGQDSLLWVPFLSQRMPASCADRVQGLTVGAEGLLHGSQQASSVGSACCRFVLQTQQAQAF